MNVNVNADVVVPCRADDARLRLESLLGVATRGHGRTSISALHWASTRWSRRFFPTVDADIAVTAIDDTSCLLTVAGVYRPPFGRLGGLADRALMHRFATSTATEFANRVGRLIAQATNDARP